MDERALLRRRSRTHAIVEGALLGDIAIVFLLMRVYLPVPVVRTLLRTVASVPFVMLVQRRGLRVAILAAIASYMLFSALVGPILGLSALDIALAGILIGVGRDAGLGAALNTIWASVVWAILDLIIPTIISVFIFRFPVHTLVTAARRFIRMIFNLFYWVLQHSGAPHNVLSTVSSWKGPAVDHWQVSWVVLMIFVAFLNIYLVTLVSEMVLKQVPEGTLERQTA